METIYTGKEKRLHYKLVKKIIREHKLDVADISQIYFDQKMPTDKFPLWTLTITIYGAGHMYNSELAKKDILIKESVRHGFYITWANLKHYSW